MEILAQFRVDDGCDLNACSTGGSLFCSASSDGERSHVFYNLRIHGAFPQVQGAFDKAKERKGGGPG